MVQYSSFGLLSPNSTCNRVGTLNQLSYIESAGICCAVSEKPAIPLYSAVSEAPRSVSDPGVSMTPCNAMPASDQVDIHWTFYHLSTKILSTSTSPCLNRLHLQFALREFRDLRSKNRTKHERRHTPYLGFTLLPGQEFLPNSAFKKYSA